RGRISSSSPYRLSESSKINPSLIGCAGHRRLLRHRGLAFVSEDVHGTHPIGGSRLKILIEEAGNGMDAFMRRHLRRARRDAQDTVAGEILLIVSIPAD